MRYLWERFWPLRIGRHWERDRFPFYRCQHCGLRWEGVSLFALLLLRADCHEHGKRGADAR